MTSLCRIMYGQNTTKFRLRIARGDEKPDLVDSGLEAREMIAIPLEGCGEISF